MTAFDRLSLTELCTFSISIPGGTKGNNAVSSNMKVCGLGWVKQMCAICVKMRLYLCLPNVRQV